MYPGFQRTKPVDHPLLLTAGVEMVAAQPEGLPLVSSSGQQPSPPGCGAETGPGLQREEPLHTLQDPEQNENAAPLLRSH